LEKAWIGLHDNLTSWTWSYAATGLGYYSDGEADYRRWDFGQPDNFLGEQMCIWMLSGGFWDDGQCFLRSSSVCYDGADTSLGLKWH